MKAYLNENNVVIAIGENDELFPNCTIVEITEDEKLFIESCKFPKYLNSEFVEGITEYEITQEKLEQALLIDSQYKNKISELLRIPIQKVLCKDIEEIPIEILEQRELLKLECNEKILALGITDFTYRKTIKGL